MGELAIELAGNDFMAWAAASLAASAAYYSGEDKLHARVLALLSELNGGLQQVENLIQQKARLYVRQARILADRTAQNLQTVARGLSRIPGRKTVVFLSEGFYLEDSRGLIESIAAQAARGGTTIYTIDGRGLIGAPSPTADARTNDRGRSTAFDTGDDGPNILTASTGGFMVRNIDDMSRAFGMIVTK